jgi:hypothetical protein
VSFKVAIVPKDKTAKLTPQKPAQKTSLLSSQKTTEKSTPQKMNRRHNSTVINENIIGALADRNFEQNMMGMSPDKANIFDE